MCILHGFKRGLLRVIESEVEILRKSWIHGEIILERELCPVLAM